MFLKAIGITGGALYAGSMISTTFRKKVERNLIQPFKDFNAVLNDDQSFFMPEDLSKFGRDLSKGCKNMLKYESDN